MSADHLGAFYRYVYKRTANSSGIGVIMDSNRVAITNDREKANAFNQFFSSVGVTDNNSVPCCNDVPLLSTLDNVVSETDVFRSISKLRSNSSSGPVSAIHWHSCIINSFLWVCYLLSGSPHT